MTTDIITRVVNVLERAVQTQSYSSYAMILYAGVLVFGLLNGILGYRLLRFWMMLGGFFLGACAGFLLVYSSGTQENMMYVGAMLALGIVLAVISFLIYKAGIFILGLALGFGLSLYILHPTTSSVFFCCILVGVGLGVLAVRFARGVIIVATSLAGGIMAGFALAGIGSLPEIPYGIALSAAFAILGMLIQFAINRPKEDDDEEEHTNRRKKPEYDIDEEEIEEEYIEELIEEDKEASEKLKKKLRPHK